VLPIVQGRCQGCHNRGGIGPFPLLTYENARARHTKIAKAVRTRQMPPWMPADGCRDLDGSRRLPQADIDTIVAWSRGGAIAGRPTDATPPAKPAPGLPWVDATLAPSVDYTPRPPPGGKDDYRCFVVRPNLSEDRDVIGVDIQPGVRRLVHHVLLFDADPRDAAKLDGPRGEGWYCFGSSGLPARAIGIWTPGTGPTRYPAGTGITLQAGKVLVMQVHYNLENRRPAPDRTWVKLQYARERVPRPAVFQGPEISPVLVIPPKTTGYTLTSPAAGLGNRTVWGLLPHMHTLGRRIKVEADGQCLIDIPAWDFHWQGLYFFKEPIRLGPGSAGRVTCSWDNPTDQPVLWGETTDREMCVGSLYTTD
jgi:hypothetical protein